MRDLSQWLSGIQEVASWKERLISDSFSFLAQSSGTPVAQTGEIAASSPGISIPVLVAGAIVLLVLVAVSAWMLGKSQGQSKPSDKEPRLEQPSDDSTRPGKSILDQRDTLEAPPEISDDDSLAELKKKKMARVQVGGYEEAKKLLDERKSTRVRAVREEELAARKEHEEENDSGEAQSADSSAISNDEEKGDSKPSSGILDGLLSGDADDSSWDVGGDLDVADLDIPGVTAAPLKESADASAKNIVKKEPVEKSAAQLAKERVREREERQRAEDEAIAREQSRRKARAETPKSLEKGLEKTRTGFISKLGKLFKSQETMDEDLVEEIEEVLYTADIGPKTVQELLERVEEEMDKGELSDPRRVWSFLRERMEDILTENEHPLVIHPKPFVMLVVGVNGAGKTTTIGKLATRFVDDGYKVMMVAGDTFRAAATEQLEEWGARTGLPVHVGKDGEDPASVVYAGIERGQREGADIIICDTAGRLTNKKNLMRELEKIGRVCGRALDGAPHETLLVLDANTGRMAIEQARLFQEVVDITGIVLTKLDGTAKGGIILGISQELQVPVRYIGIGEGVYDLRTFHAEEFVEALFM